MSDDDWSLKGKIKYSNNTMYGSLSNNDLEVIEKKDIDTLREKLIEDFRNRCWRGRHIGLGDIEQIINKRFGVD